RATELDLAEARRTWTVLASQPGHAWGYTHGVNEKGVAAGSTPIDTRLECDGPGLSGLDLVRLALERGGSARQAVEVVTALICRHGQDATWGQMRRNAAL